MKKLDRMTPIAVGGALGAVLFSMVIEGSNPMVLFKPAPLILVFVGTVITTVGRLCTLIVHVALLVAKPSSTLNCNTYVPLLVNIAVVAACAGLPNVTTPLLLTTLHKIFVT